MSRWYAFFFFYFIIFVFSANAQIELKYTHPVVMKNGVVLPLAFAGGLNSPQFQETDFDLDGDMDLVVFERSSDMIICFENVEGSYVHNPYFASLFPSDLQHWIVLADYNCDGENDLFTPSNTGVRVLRGERQLFDVLHWEPEIDPLLTSGISGPVNVLFNPTDIPSIVDLDGDGDLDFLYFNFANGDQIEFHKNHSLTGTDGACGLELVRESTQYGDIDVCECDEFSFEGETCHAASKVLHVAGKALLSYDQNGDGVMELVVSQEECANVSFLPNSGSSSVPFFDSVVNNFPTFDAPLNFPSFPAAYYIDVTFDGQKDMLIAQNVREDDHGEIDFTQSSFLFENNGNNDFPESRSFLQDQMIDVGSAAYPAWADINGDGLDDLVLAHDQGKLTCYLQSSSGLEFLTDDLFDLSELGYVRFKTQFLDLDADGRKDLVLGAHAQTTHDNLFLYFLNESENDEMQIDIQNPLSFNYSLADKDDFFLYDMDSDGEIDLLIGNVFGELDYYRNVGNFDFQLETADLLTVEPNAQNSNLSISIGDLDQDGKSDLITTRKNGQMSIYFNFPENTSEAANQIIKFENVENLGKTHFGRKSKPAFGRMNGNAVLAVGTLQGGVAMLESSTDDTGLVLDAFPNPSLTNFMNFRISEDAGHLQILDLSGKPVSQIFEISFFETLSLDLSFLKSGIYLAQVHVNGVRCSKRIKIIK